MSLNYQIVYWRDIPAQIRVRSGDRRTNRQLSPRFQEAIDAAAMHATATSSDDYLAEWRSTEWQQAEGDLELFAEQLSDQIEAEYPPERLKAMVLNKGFEVAD